MSVNDYNNRANGQRFAGTNYEPVKLSTPVIPMWRAGYKDTSNVYYQPIENRISAVVGTTPYKVEFETPNGYNINTYKTQAAPVVGGWINEYISATNLQRAAVISALATKLN